MKEKAQELYDAFYELDHLIETPYAKEQCKKRCMIAVNEILNSVDAIRMPYWREVKKHIENL